MAYQALYRKWRPLDFDDLVGQKSISNTLKNEIKLGRIGHAYLFCGPRGTGKTSTARILSRSVNCLNPNEGNPCNICQNCKGILDGSILDITEIDAASNNGVENIRDLRDGVRFSGSALERKVYIIDEVHMLSNSAFNALLKTLEEPPPNVHFILATTEAHKVPQTILSRCQRFDFRRINVSDIEGQIKKIIAADGVSVEDRAIRIIAEKADGSMRDALSILDQCMAVGDGSLSYEDIRYFLGICDFEYIRDLADAVAKRDAAAAFGVIGEYVSSGKGISAMLDEFIRFMRNALMLKYLAENQLDIPEDEIEDAKEMSSAVSEERLVYIIKIACETAAALRTGLTPRIIFETAVVRMIHPSYDNSSDGIAARLGAVEEALAAGTVVKSSPPAEKTEKKVQKQETPPPPPPKKISNVSDEVVKAVIPAIGKIKKELYDANNLQTAMALECATVSEKDGKVCLLYKNVGECAAYRAFLDEENIESITKSIKKHTGHDVMLTIGIEEEKLPKQDNLDVLYKQINPDG